MIWLIIAIILVSAVCGYFIYRGYVLAGLLADSEEYVNEVEEMANYMYQRIDRVYQRMQQIDSRGSFEADDEAGSTFQMLKDVIDKLQKEFNAETEEKAK